jgi:chromosome segregation ATPase
VVVTWSQEIYKDCPMCCVGFAKMTENMTERDNMTENLKKQLESKQRECTVLQKRLHEHACVLHEQKKQAAFELEMMQRSRDNLRDLKGEEEKRCACVIARKEKEHKETRDGYEKQVADLKKMVNEAHKQNDGAYERIGNLTRCNDEYRKQLEECLKEKELLTSLQQDYQNLVTSHKGLEECLSRRESLIGTYFARIHELEKLYGDSKVSYNGLVLENQELKNTISRLDSLSLKYREKITSLEKTLVDLKASTAKRVYRKQLHIFSNCMADMHRRIDEAMQALEKDGVASAPLENTQA